MNVNEYRNDVYDVKAWVPKVVNCSVLLISGQPVLASSNQWQSPEQSSGKPRGPKL